MADPVRVRLLDLIRLAPGTRRFILRWPWLLVTAAACTLFVSLGFWQWGRGVHREQVWAEFERAAAAEPQAVTGERLAGLPRYARIRVSGHYDAAHQLLLDNISRDGRPGYEVLTPLDLEGGTTLLVNRGWLPFTGYRDRLPDVSMAAEAAGAADADGSVTLAGRLDGLPQPGLASGRVPPASSGSWPRLTSFPTTADLSQALGRPVTAGVLLLDAASGPGYDRRWLPPGISPERNYSYAVQWWSFATLALALFVFLSVEKRR